MDSARLDDQSAMFQSKLRQIIQFEFHLKSEINTIIEEGLKESINEVDSNYVFQRRDEYQLKSSGFKPMNEIVSDQIEQQFLQLKNSSKVKDLEHKE